MENKRLEYLLNSYFARTASPAEENELFDILSSDKSDEQVRDYMARAWPGQVNGNFISDEQSNRILSSILIKQDGKVVKLNSHRFRKSLFWAAASVVIITTGVLLFTILNQSSTEKSPLAKTIESHTYKNDAAPGSTGAVLKLADGSSIVLDSATDGQLAVQEDMQIMKQGGSLSYVGEEASVSQALVYNTIETPRGRQYQLTLEDGTKVWLNAASSIRFPVAFPGDERRVAVSGEAYFEVAKNKRKPFRVEANGTTVQVLGTHFNLNAYADEETTNTTLLEGSVKVSKGDKQKIISPGQQAQVNATGDLTTEKNVNIAEVLAWKDNHFSFNNTDIKKLMRQLSRWYDVEIVFKNESDQPVTFIGDISRSVNLSTVLKMLEQTGEVKFEIENKKIIVLM